MKKIIKKFASLALVTSLFVGAMAPTAMAKPDRGLVKELTKTVQTKEGASVKDSFKFIIEPTTEGPKRKQITPTGEEIELKINPAPEGLVKFEKDTTDETEYTDGVKSTLNLVYDTKLLNTLVDRIKGETKIYRVKIYEDKGSRKGMTYDDSIKYMDIYVWYDQDGKTYKVVYKSVLYDQDGNKLDGLNFKNSYDEIKQLKVKKELKEADGTTDSKDKQTTFTFTINIKGQVGDIFTIGDKTYEIKEENKEYGVAIEADITNGQTLSIDGLTDNDTVTVRETSDNASNYVVTGEIRDVALKDIKDQLVTITNKEKTEIPTGLLNTIAPFILIIGLAGGLGFVYFKKNKNELA